MQNAILKLRLFFLVKFKSLICPLCVQLKTRVFEYRILVTNYCTCP